MGELEEDEGRISDTVFWSFETAAAHAESRRRDVVIDRLCTTFCDRVVQKGQMKRGKVEFEDDTFFEIRAVSRRARPPTLIASIRSLHGPDG